MLTREGNEQALRAFLAGAMSLHLYATSAGDVYIEASGGGYAPIQLHPNAWVIDGLSATYPEQVFTMTGPLGDVYGYYVTRDEAVIYGQPFADGPYPVQADDQIAVSVVLMQEV